jgi:outer membrane immunogenic protein
MRKSLMAATVLSALSAPAFAADLPSRQVAPAAPVAYAPVFTWTGFYVGLNAGYGWANSNDVSFVNTVTGATTTFSNGNDGGFVGGGQLGYNFQTGAFVFGLETDIQYADLGGSTTYGVFGTYGNNGNYFGTVRGRLGFAMDRTLLYVTGGLAYGDIGSNIFGGDDTRVGWTVGGGVEYAFTNNWTAKLEGLYVNIDRGNRGGVVAVGPSTFAVTQGKNNDFGVVRVGLNYKF